MGISWQLQPLPFPPTATPMTVVIPTVVPTRRAMQQPDCTQIIIIANIIIHSFIIIFYFHFVAHYLCCFHHRRPQPSVPPIFVFVPPRFLPLIRPIILMSSLPLAPSCYTSRELRRGRSKMRGISRCCIVCIIEFIMITKLSPTF